MRGNSLHTEGWCAIFAALRDNKESKIESWDLRDQGIDVEIANVLAEYVSVSTALKSLKCAAHMLPCPALSAAADNFFPPSFTASTATGCVVSRKAQAPSAVQRAPTLQRASSSCRMRSRSTRR